MYLFCCGHCFGFVSVTIIGDDEGGTFDSQSCFAIIAGLEFTIFLTQPLSFRSRLAAMGLQGP